MQQAAVFVRRASERFARDARRASARLHELRQLAHPTALAARVAPASHAPRPRRQASGSRGLRFLRRLRRSPILDISADRRGAPILVLCLLLIATLVALPSDGGTAIGASRPSPSAVAARIAALAGAPAGNTDPTVANTDERAFQAFDVTAPILGQTADAAGTDGQTLGTYSSDGTLLKPFAVDAVLGGIDSQVRTYKVRPGDTLGKIASKFGLNMSSLFWANKLNNKDTISIGQTLTIPPVDGVLYTVKEGDTIETIASAFHADAARIVSYNSLGADIVVIGETIMVPDGRGRAIPSAPVASGGSFVCRSCSFSGSMTWPVDGWNYISQYFWSGHQAIDIAAHYGTPVVAAVSGKVILTGWVGLGGYAIYISNGNGMYETYNHLSYIGVSVGQYVSRGSFIGRVGASGAATGPHLHFEVWFGTPYRSGYRVNPLLYF